MSVGSTTFAPIKLYSLPYILLPESGLERTGKYTELCVLQTRMLEHDSSVDNRLIAICGGVRGSSKRTTVREIHDALWCESLVPLACLIVA